MWTFLHFLTLVLPSPFFAHCLQTLPLTSTSLVIMSTFKLLYFAAASTYTGRDHDLLPAPIKASELFGLLEQRYPGITDKVLTTCAVTVNYNYIDMEDSDAALILGQGDEVALIPPVSSG